jgi:hypothetical protein
MPPRRSLTDEERYAQLPTFLAINAQVGYVDNVSGFRSGWSEPSSEVCSNTQIVALAVVYLVSKDPDRRSRAWQLLKLLLRR